MIEVLRQEIQELRDSDKNPIEFAIEAIRINLAVAVFKDELILYEAMTLLQGLSSQIQQRQTQQELDKPTEE